MDQSAGPTLTEAAGVPSGFAQEEYAEGEEKLQLGQKWVVGKWGSENGLMPSTWAIMPCNASPTTKHTQNYGSRGGGRERRERRAGYPREKALWRCRREG